MGDIKINMAENSVKIRVDVDFFGYGFTVRLIIVTFNLYWSYLWAMVI